jgi:transcriptional regulator with XRE-family HTH domain
MKYLARLQPPHYKARSEEGAPTARSQLGQRIRVLRETLSLTQEQLAEKAGISVSYLSMIERAQRTPHVETLVSLAAALGITVSQLFLDMNEPRGSGPAPDLPLMAYLGTRRLDRKELDALLKVARAMFDGKP